MKIYLMATNLFFCVCNVLEAFLKLIVLFCHVKYLPPSLSLREESIQY